MDVFLTINVDTGNGLTDIEVYYNSINDDLEKMARLATLYTTIWEPKEITAKALAVTLRRGILQLENPDMRDEYIKRESKRGLGTYESLLSFSKAYANACEKHPKCKVNVSK